MQRKIRRFEKISEKADRFLISVLTIVESISVKLWVDILNVVHNFRSSEVLIELRMCSSHISIYPECTDSASACADKKPTDKAEVKHKKLPLVSLHHSLTFINTLLPIIVGMINLDIHRH